MRISSELQRSRDATWIVIAASTMGLLVACLVQKFAIGVTSGIVVIATNAAMVALAALVRRRGWNNCADWLTATAQMAFLTSVLTALSYVLASTNMPLQDAMLIDIDRTIGVDWRSLVDSLTRQSWLMVALNYAYASLAYQLMLLLPVAFLTGHGRIASRFVLAWSIALAASVLIFPLAPALGGYLHYQLKPDDFPDVRILAAWLFVPPLHALRDGSLNVVDLKALDGIITFPSFHAAVAVLFIWVASGISYLRYPMIILNALMLVSAVPIGGHYLIDVVGGSLVAIASILAARSWAGSTQPRIGLSTVPAEA
jgi:membrane-associated phospholipid phosphatase